MELKVWVDGVVRVVCGLSYNTSCQDVVIALAQAIGKSAQHLIWGPQELTVVLLRQFYLLVWYIRDTQNLTTQNM